MTRWFRLFAFLPPCLLVVGCSASKDEQTVQVSGTVNLDKKPLREGDIVFLGEAGTIPDILPIRNGSFEGPVKPGKKRVEILAYRTAKPPETATDTTEEFKENYIPDRYNSNSRLTAEVTAGGVSPNKFDVESR